MGVSILFKLTSISLAILIATVVNCLVAYNSWQRRKAKSGLYFAVAMIAATFWTLVAALDYAAVPVALKISFAKLEYLSYTCALAFFTAFALSYAGYEDWLKKTWVKLLLIGLPAVTTLLAWTNDLHSWVWSGFTPNPAADNVLIFEHGPAFTLIAAVGYGLILVILVSLLAASLKGTSLARRQARLLLGALLALVASNLIYLLDIFNIPGVDWSSVAFSIVGVLFLFALYGSRFMDIVPIARNTLIEHMDDGVVVLDMRGNLVDFNPAAQAILGLNSANLWTSSTDALANWPDIRAWVANPIGAQAIEIVTGQPPQNYDLRLTPLIDNRTEMYGLLLVMRNITARKQAEAALVQAKEAAESANALLSANVAELAARNEELDTFAHTVAHDIRSPIAQLLSYARVLHEYQDSLSVDERAHLRLTILKSGNKLIRIIDELLLLAGLRNVEAQAEQLNMAAIVAEAEGRVSDLIEQSKAVITLPIKSAWPVALGHPAWVEEVWVNYLGNACKYGGIDGQPPRITLGADLVPDPRDSQQIVQESTAGFIRFWVRDAGRGLTDEDRARLFTPFTRLNQVRATGHGLGLSIVRRIIEKLGGEVGVDSDGVPGHGSTFYFTLPAAPAGTVAPPAEPVEPSPAQISFHGVTVLVVDDDTLFAQSVRSLLTARGWQVLGVAHDGKQAQALAETLQPELILMDIDMPGLNGLEATRLIKVEHPGMKIVMFTASEREADLFEAIRNGASGYLLKGAPAEVFFDQLSALARGESPLSPGMANRLLAEFARLSTSAASVSQDQPVAIPPASLTDRQWNILERVARGQTYKEIGSDLHLSEPAVRYHMGQIVERLHVSNRAEAVAYLRRHARPAN